MQCPMVCAVIASPPPRCDNCGNPIKQDPRGGWTHGAGSDDWQGKRCPGRLTGAVITSPVVRCHPQDRSEEKGRTE